MKNQIGSYGECYLSLFCITFVTFSHKKPVRIVSLGSDIILANQIETTSRFNSAKRIACKMKTRKKCASKNSSIIENSRKISKPNKRNVDKIKLVASLKELTKNTDRSMLHIDDADSKTLAKRFKIPQKVVENKIAEMQPIIKIRKM